MNNTERKLGILCAAAFTAAAVFSAAAQDQGGNTPPPAEGGGDAAEAPAAPVKPRPAEIMPLTAKGLLLDVTKAGDKYVAVDVYDNRDQLWRVQEAHTVMAYDKPYQLPICETVYDLQSNRYLVMSLNNEDPETASKEFDDSYFDPANVSKLAK